MQHRSRGYILIMLMLAMTLAAVALLAVLPEIGQQIKRDREEEMRHRGTSYMRAIQHFNKKFGRYPSRIEELENTNNLRFLRKRYTDPLSVDPVTGKEKDFKLLHQQDITLNQGPLLGATPGQQPGLGPAAGGGGGSLLSAGGFGSPGLGSPGGVNGPGGLPGQSATGTQTPAGGTSGNASNTGGNSDSGSSPASGSSSTPSTSASGPTSGLNGPTFGGGPILGVASTSKAKSIRVFYDKNHYNDWLFIYIPQTDRGGLLVGPVSLNGPTGNMPGGFAPGQLPGQQPGSGQGFGQSMTPNGGQLQNNPIQASPSPSQNSPQP
ncbi:MAG: hypothetical protein ABSD75_22070 [Terriglobales bacterium]